MNKQGTVYTVIFIFIVSVVFVAVLSVTNAATIEQVEFNQEIARQTAVLSAMGIDADSEAEVQEKYQDVTADVDAGLYVADVGGETVYGKRFAGAGLWGTIEGVLAVSSDFERIIGIEIVSDNETPGLGGRINEPWFKEQFRNEEVGDAGIDVRRVSAEGDPDRGNGVIDGITGATRTSDSMETIVNAELETLRSNEVREELRTLAAQGGQS